MIVSTWLPRPTDRQSETSLRPRRTTRLGELLLDVLLLPLFWAFVCAFWMGRRVHWFFTILAPIYALLFVGYILNPFPDQMRNRNRTVDLLMLGGGTVFFSLLAVMSWKARPRPLTAEQLRRLEEESLQRKQREIDQRRLRAERISREMSADDVISASVVWPGFGSDLSTWQLFISRDGRVRQRVDIATSENQYRSEPAIEHAAEIDPAEVTAILAIADRARFQHFKDYYESETVDATDMAQLSISVRFDTEVKTVEAHGPDLIAEEDKNADMIAYLQMWALIHRHAPYPGTDEAAIADNEAG